MEEQKNYLSILAEEYKSLREESRQASINMFTSLQWGAAIIGVIIAASFTQWNKEHAVVLITFLFIVPLLCAIAMFLWLGEAARFKRVGDYICLIEQKVGIVLQDFKDKMELKQKWEFYRNKIEDNLSMSRDNMDFADPLTWEQWLKNMKGKKATEGHMKIIYAFRMALFILIMFTSFIIGVYYVFTHPKFIPAWATDLSISLPSVKINITILLIVSIALITISSGLAFKLAKRLDVKTKPIFREPYIKAEEENVSEDAT